MTFHPIADREKSTMPFPFLLRCLNWGSERNRNARMQPRRQQRQPTTARLSVEQLEDRTVPSTFTVLNLADSGSGSLRQAVLTANATAGADTIAFAAGLSGTVTLQSGEMTITDDLGIGGPGASQLTVSGNHLGRVFRMSGSTTAVAISGLTIADGLATGTTTLGGGIFNDSGHLTLTSMTFTGNQAVGDDKPTAVAGGGAVASINGATLTVTGCTFTGNGSVAADRSEGGAILSDAASTLTVGGSLFADNQSLSLGGATEHHEWFGGSGGAVSSLGDSAATFSATTFTRNRALGGDGTPGQDGAVAQGGAITNSSSLLAGGVNALAGTLTLDHVTFTENTAAGGDGGPSVNAGAGGAGAITAGGAIYNDIGGRLTVTDSTFIRNQSIGGAGGEGTGKGNGGRGGNSVGGAIATQRGHLIIQRSSFVENCSVGGTGGASQVQGGNGGRGKGGAIHMPAYPGFFPSPDPLVAELDDVTFLRNETIGGNGGDGGTGTGGNGFRARGGALSISDGKLDGTRLVVRHCQLDGNIARGGQGGAGATRGRGGDAFGGGISNGEPGGYGLGEDPINFLFVSDSIIANNRAVGGAGSVGGLGRGGGIDNANRSTATISGTLLGGNQALGGSGTVTGGDGLGGGLYNEIRSDVTLRGCTVTGNQAIGGSGPTAGSGLGGGVYNTAGGTVWVDVVTAILANDASTSDDDVFGILTPL
jgi:hypothetical protein